MFNDFMLNIYMFVFKMFSSHSSPASLAVVYYFVIAIVTL